MSTPLEDSEGTLLFFGHLLLSLKASMISLRGIAPGRLHHAPNTDAARVLSSDSECLILETIRPPCKNACSTSVEVAVYDAIRFLQ